MAVEIIRNIVLKPSPSFPPHPLVNSKLPLTIFDRATFNLHLVALYAFKPPMPTLEALEEAFSQVLHHFPLLCGRFTTDEQGRPSILLNNAGIRGIQTSVGMTLEEFLPLSTSAELNKLYPRFEGVEELFQIQVNRYTCGGMIMGTTSHHHIGDGSSMSLFTSALSKHIRGLEIDLVPYYDRSTVIVPRNPPVCEFNHRSIEFRERSTPAFSATNSQSSSISNLAVNFSSEFMTKLKTHVRDVAPGQKKYSTFECMLAHLWKKVTIARGLDENEFTQVRVAVNGRERLWPTVPIEYFGNLVLWACPRLRVKDLLNENYAFVTKTIRDAVTKVDRAYFQSFMDFGEMLTREEEEALVPAAPPLRSLQSPNLQVDSWLYFQLHEFDMGHGGPIEMLLPELPAEGVMFFLPSSRERGGVQACVALQQQHVDHFKQISHSLPPEIELRSGYQKMGKSPL